LTAPGTLRTYLGIAPGVGKTYAMLAEGRRRRESGERVVVGWVEKHGRQETRAQRGDLEMVPPRTLSYRGSTFAELDVTAVITSGANVALVDELAHSVPDSKRERWQDVADLLAAGLDVVTTTNVANLRSARDYAAGLTGIGAVESVPDEFVRSGEVVLVDMPADALRQRIATGRVYSADQVGGALVDYFRASNLEALSELGRAWMAGDVNAVGRDLLVRRGLLAPPPRPLVLAGVSGSRRGEQVVRKAAEIARENDADLVVLHVDETDSSPRQVHELEQNRQLSVELGGSFTEILGTSPARTLADVARARGASQVVVARSRSRLRHSSRRSVAARLRRLLPEVTVREVG